MSDSPVLVYKQRWIVILPDGRQFDAGASYHLDPKQRDLMVADVAARLSTDVHGEREEPTGDLCPIQTTPEYYQKIKATRSGLRVK